MATSVILHSEEHGSFYWIIISGISLGPSIGEGSHVTCFQSHHWRIPSYQSKKQSTRGTMESPKLLLHGSCHVLTPLKQCRNAAWCHGNFQRHDLAHVVSTNIGEGKVASALHPSSCKVTKLQFTCVTCKVYPRGEQLKKISLQALTQSHVICQDALHWPVSPIRV